MAWHQKEIKEVFEELASSPKGLSSEEAGKRLEQYGHNALSHERGAAPINDAYRDFSCSRRHS